MKLYIGITPSMNEHGYYEVNELHTTIVEKLGGIPVIIPYVKNEHSIKTIINQLDGLYVTGGDDIDPTLFHEEPLPNLRKICRQRDLFERTMIQKMLQQDKPILAICRGAQMLNIATGGNMYQHIYGQISTPLLQHEQRASKESPTHFIDIKESSLLFQITHKKRMKVNSFHHQAIRVVKAPFIISATASDGVIEAIESTNHLFAVGVQWHPEFLFANDYATLSMYKTFIKKCEERKQ